MRRKAVALPGGGVSFTRRPTSARQRRTSCPIWRSLTFPPLATRFLLTCCIDEQIVDACLANGAASSAAACLGLDADCDAGFATPLCVVPQAARTRATGTAP